MPAGHSPGRHWQGRDGGKEGDGVAAALVLRSGPVVSEVRNNRDVLAGRLLVDAASVDSPCVVVAECRQTGLGGPWASYGDAVRGGGCGRGSRGGRRRGCGRCGCGRRGRGGRYQLSHHLTVKTWRERREGCQYFSM